MSLDIGVDGRLKECEMKEERKKKIDESKEEKGDCNLKERKGDKVELK